MSRRTKRTLILGLSVFGALLLAMTSRVNVAQAIPSVSVAGPPAIQCGSGGTFSAVIRDGLVPVIGATVTFSSSQPGAFFPANIVTNAAGTAATLFVPSVATFGATATVSAGASGGIPVATATKHGNQATTIRRHGPRRV